MSGELRRALDGLAAEIAGETAAEPEQRDATTRGGALDGGDDPAGISRSQLLRGAALLTGRGDLAQDCVHVAAARTGLGEGGGPPGRARLCGEVLRAVRSRPVDG